MKKIIIINIIWILLIIFLFIYEVITVMSWKRDLVITNLVINTKHVNAWVADDVVFQIDHFFIRVFVMGLFANIAYFILRKKEIV